MKKPQKPVNIKDIRVCLCDDVTRIHIAEEYGRQAIAGRNCWCARKGDKALKREGDFVLKIKMFERR